MSEVNGPEVDLPVAPDANGNGASEIVEIDGQSEERRQSVALPDNEPERLAVLEALIFAHGEPIEAERLSAVLNLEAPELDQMLASLSAKYQDSSFGMELVLVAGKYQFRTKSALAMYVCLLKEQKPRKLSAAALETLSVIAYRQPVTRHEIETIRGVDPTPTLKTLLEKDLVTIVGHKESVGQPGLYGTTEKFLHIFGLASLADLPALRELKQVEGDPGEAWEEEAEPVAAEEAGLE